MAMMLGNLVHPYIQSTIVLCDTHMHMNGMFHVCVSEDITDYPNTQLTYLNVREWLKSVSPLPVAK